MTKDQVKNATDIELIQEYQRRAYGEDFQRTGQGWEENMMRQGKRQEVERKLLELIGDEPEPEPPQE